MSAADARALRFAIASCNCADLWRGRHGTRAQSPVGQAACSQGTGCAWGPIYISSHDTRWRRSFEQRRIGAPSQQGETGHQDDVAAPTLAGAKAERAARIKGAGSHGQDAKLVLPLVGGVIGAPVRTKPDIGRAVERGRMGGADKRLIAGDIAGGAGSLRS
jgi:hypothetical protein